MDFAILGFKIRLSFYFCALIMIFLLFDNDSIMPYILTGIFIHECGHLLAFIFSGKQVDKIVFSAIGIDIKTHELNTSLTESVFIHISGPAANIIAAAISFYCFRNEYFSAANLTLGIFHLLPISGLDGGNLIKCLLIKALPIYAVEKVVISVSYIFILILFLFGIFLLFITNGNFSLIAVSIALLLSIRKGKNSY